MSEAERDAVVLPDRPGAPGGELTRLRWRRDGAPPVVFTHATGMCASAYRQFLAPLSADFDITAPDMRGHGRSGLLPTGRTLNNWQVYARDIEAMLLARDQPADGWRLMGHSMGSVTALLVAAAGRVQVSRLILIEPVIVPAWVRLLAQTPAVWILQRQMPIANRARKRRQNWDSRAAAQQSYARKGFFRRWADGVLDDYLADAVQESAGAATLSCPPFWEAATFAGQGQNVWDAFRTIAGRGGPVPQVLIAEHDSTVIGSAPARLAQRGVATTLVPGSSHLIPQEQPQELARLVAPLLR